MGFVTMAKANRLVACDVPADPDRPHAEDPLRPWRTTAATPPKPLQTLVMDLSPLLLLVISQHLETSLLDVFRSAAPV